MTIFKKKITKAWFYEIGLLLISLLFAMILASCIKPRTKTAEQLEDEGQRKEEESATFEAEPVTATSTPGAIDRVWQLPRSRGYDFQVCLHDRRTRDPIRGEKFSVLGAPGRPEVISDASGCVRWHEDVNFNFLGDSKYIFLERKLDAKGLHTGRLVMELAVNPWADTGFPEFVDLRANPGAVREEWLVRGDAASARALAGRTRDDQAQTRNLYVDDLRFQFTEIMGASQGMDLQLSLSLTPKFTSQNIRGESSLRPLTGGKYIIKAYLVGVTRNSSQTSRTLLVESQRARPVRLNGQSAASSQAAISVEDERPQYVYSQGGKIAAEFNLNLRHQLNSGQYELGIRLIPVDAPAGLESFEGVYFVGDHRSLFNFRMSDVQRPNMSTIADGFNFETYLAAMRRLDPDATAAEPGIRDLRAIEFSYAQVLEKLRVIWNSTGSERELFFRLKTCVINPISGTKLLNTPFQIQKINGEIETITTSADEGCLIWTDSLKHKYFEPERYLTRDVVIKDEGGFSRTLSFVINPWDFEGRLLADRREDPNGTYYANVNARTPQPAQILVSRFTYEIEDNLEHKVDSHLALEIGKPLNLSFEPKLLRPSSLRNGQNHVENLPAGIYLLRVGLRADYHEQWGVPVKHITTYQRLVKVTNLGVQSAPIKFTARDIREIRVRAHFLLELLPLDPNKITPEIEQTLEVPGRQYEYLVDRRSALNPRTFYGPMVLVTNNYSGSLRPTDAPNGLLCSSDACNEVEDWRAAEASISEQMNLMKYYSETAHLRGLTVTSLLREERELKAEREANMQSRSELWRYLEQNQLEYFQLSHEENLGQRNLKLRESNRLLPDSLFTARVGALLNTVEQRWPMEQQAPAVGPSDFRDLIYNRNFSDGLKIKLCRFWFEKFMPAHVPFGKKIGITWASSMEREFEGTEIVKCLQGVTDDVSNVFIAERKIRVFELADPGEKVFGRFLNIQVGANYRMSYSESVTHSQTLSFSPLGVLELVAGAVGRATTGLAKAAGLLASNSGLGMTISRSESTDQSISNDSYLSANNFLVNSQRTMQLTFSRYEVCTVLRLNPYFITNDQHLMNLFHELSDQEVAQLITRGILLCSGEEATTPIQRLESYYYFSQLFVDESVLDSGEPLNHPWLLSLRGQRDYAAFLALVRGPEVDPAEVSGDIDLASKPLVELERAYRLVLPTFPGIYNDDD